MLRSVVASRWPDQLAANAATEASPPPDHPDAAATTVADAPQPGAATVPLATAGSPTENPGISTQMLLIAIVAAISVAGLAASAIGFGGKRNRVAFEPEEEQEPRRPIWEMADRSPFPDIAASRPNIGVPRELREADDPDDKIAEMLARLARSAQA